MRKITELIEMIVLEELDLGRVIADALPEVLPAFHEAMNNSLREALQQYVEDLDIPHMLKRMDLDDIVYEKLGTRLLVALNKAFELIDEDLSADHLELLDTLMTAIEWPELSVRLKNVLKEARMAYIGDLFRLRNRRASLLKLRNFGSKCMREVEEMLQWRGLSIDQVIPVRVMTKYESFREQQNN
jgi:hypothetical protein